MGPAAAGACGRIGDVFVPKGRQDSARGFNPGNQSKKGPAPTGRKNDRDQGVSSNEILEVFLFRPFRAGRDFDVLLGLKPQAESYRPFGTNGPIQDQGSEPPGEC